MRTLEYIEIVFFCNKHVNFHIYVEQVSLGSFPLNVTTRHFSREGTPSPTGLILAGI